jgi:hypothetical protein
MDLRRISPVRSTPIGAYVRDGLPAAYGVVFHDADKRRVLTAWLFLNVLIRWGLWFFWYVKRPGHFGPFARSKALKRVQQLERKTGALSHAFAIQEPVLQIARRLSTAKVKEWPDRMVELRREVLRAESLTLALYANERDVKELYSEAAGGQGGNRGGAHANVVS